MPFAELDPTRLVCTILGSLVDLQLAVGPSKPLFSRARSTAALHFDI
jgi:hypothetical protein